MNAEQIHWPPDDWPWFKAKLVQQWPALNESDLDLARMAPDMIVGRLQRHYRLTHEQAQRELHIFLNSTLVRV